MGGLPEGAEIVLLVDGTQVIKTGRLVRRTSTGSRRRTACSFNFKVLCSTGWTDVEEVARRRFWEHESIVALSVRAGKARFACGTEVPIIRGGKKAVTQVEQLAAGDTLSFHDYMMLRNGHTDPRKQVIVRGQGLMEKQKIPAEGIKLYFLKTASGDIVADGIVVLAGKQ